MKKILLLFVCLLVTGVGSLWAQSRQVSGVVTEKETGQPAIGIGVLIKGTSTGVATDENGRYTITVPEDAVLVFTGMSMKTQEISVGSRSVINVEMEEDAQLLTGVVFSDNYGRNRDRNMLTSSIETIDSEKLQQTPTGNALQTLQGKSAGMTVISAGGRPGSSAQVSIRGISSIDANTSPLYIIDGMPATAGDFSALNPNDFENMSVLKDAAATSIYGSRGANGVVLVTTKQGISQKAEITYRGQAGWSTLTQNKFKMMNTEQRVAFEKKYSIANTLGTTTDMELYNRLISVNIDQRDAVFQEPLLHAHELSVRGGSEKVRYFVSGSYFTQGGTFPGSDFTRMTARLNLTADANNWLKVTVNASAGSDSYNYGNEVQNSIWNPGNMAYFAMPYENLHNPDGSWKKNLEWGGYNGYVNGVWALVNAQESNDGSLNFAGKFTADISFTKDLKLTTSLAGTLMDYTSRAYTNPEVSSVGGSGSRGFERYDQMIQTNTLNYGKTFLEDHTINVLVGTEYTHAKDQSFSVGASNTSPYIKELSAMKTATSWGSARSEWVMMSFFGNINYGYKNKYYLDFSLRDDGASNFGSGYRYAMFWATSASWNIKNEEFMANIDWLSSLKLRASVGTSGNIDGIGWYAALPLYSSTSYFGQAGTVNAQLGNDELTWEKLMSWNVGLDMSFLERFNASVDVYNKTTFDMLLDVPISSTTGFTAVKKNMGEMINRGIEVSLDADILKTEDFLLNIGGNFAYNYNEVTELYGDRDEYGQSGTGIVTKVGYPYGQFRYVRFAGINAANGDALWLDKDGNVTDTYSDDHAVILEGKQWHAPIAGGFYLNASWKGFSVNAQFSYVLGKWMINNTKYFIENTYSGGGWLGFNRSTRVLDAWEKPGDITEIPRVDDPEGMNFDTRLLEDASFLRLKDLQVSYTFDKKVLEPLKILGGAKVYFKASNLLTFTKYTGYDPESVSNLELGGYPAARVITFGLDLTF